MDIKFKNKEEELLYRVFKMIERSYFQDHKAIAWYCNKVSFDRGIGDDHGYK
jgi:hypothetical protein